MGRLGELLVILAIVFMLFGTKRLKDFGGDLGAAIKGFKKNMGDDDKDKSVDAPIEPKNLANPVIEGQAEHVKQPDHQSKS
ncbi:MAG TPA: twin-arginine translocase TatA/TatE family subunit [Spongiibacteraceae bacterium]|nr:twin-arginine translocase TatA/TatE family subunit [Spongiibacteraceae bacterium]